MSARSKRRQLPHIKLNTRFRLTKKNQINNIRKKRTKAKIDFKIYEEQLEKLTEVINSATTSEKDLEIYTINHRIIHLLLLQLVLKGTEKSLKLANKYSDKTGIVVDVDKFRREVSSKAPTIRNTIKRVKESSNKPTYGSMATGWVWDY